MKLQFLKAEEDGMIIQVSGKEYRRISSRHQFLENGYGCQQSIFVLLISNWIIIRKLLDQVKDQATRYVTLGVFKGNLRKFKKFIRK